MNRALVEWLMLPDCPATELELEDFFGRPDWHQRALCRGQGPELFVCGLGGNYGPLRALCAQCPVREDCLGVALADKTLQGLWAGTGARERGRCGARRRGHRGRRGE